MPFYGPEMSTYYVDHCKGSPVIHSEQISEMENRPLSQNICNSQVFHG